MPDRRTFTAPVAGTYHFSSFGTPHLVAECGPHCVSYLKLPEGATVVPLEASPAEYAVGEMPGLIEAPADMTPEQIAEFQAAWDAMTNDGPLQPVAWLTAPRTFEYPMGGCDG